MPFVNVSDDDYCFLIHWCDVYGGTVESLLHDRVQIFRSAAAVASKVALKLVPAEPSPELKVLLCDFDDIPAIC